MCSIGDGECAGGEGQRPAFTHGAGSNLTPGSARNSIATHPIIGDGIAYVNHDISCIPLTKSVGSQVGPIGDGEGTGGEGQRPAFAHGIRIDLTPSTARNSIAAHPIKGGGIAHINRDISRISLTQGTGI